MPTFKEAPNVAPLVAKLEAALEGIAWQVIFVDDNSPDGTAAEVKAIARIDRRVACLRRVGRRGLAGAVIEGALASAAPFVAVIDGDMQHDETLLPAMLQVLRGGQADLVIGSRYLGHEARVVTGLDARRRLVSRFANWLGQRALSVQLTDPVSGFFMIRRELIDAVAPKLAANGFKVLFDIVASQPTPPRCVELGYEFRPRVAGESKLDHGVVAHYLTLLGSKMSRDVISPRALMFLAVGASGVLVNVAVVYALAGMPFLDAQAIGAVVAMTSNYLINNTITYRDKRKRGVALLTGYLRFCLLCAIGLAANVAVANLVFQHVPQRWVGVLAGAGVGAAWNYVTTSLAVW
ncbi:glycosyltransferase family 2 protein [Phenylobacterium hankyongense]|uniref:glycosyltransferase family 2 protein n=1 Tax=Phenylobacterium hankyongense TaxID=1813876 RepID=UPI001A9CD3DD|nr:glycosyltransferase family 2 protein [Phenylobacterium hankyongense]